MFEKIFKGLERAHGCTKVTTPAENGVKLKGQSFVVRQPVTTELWKMHLDGTQSLGIIPINEGGWVHISYHESDSNRKQVLTFDGKKYTEGLPEMKWSGGKVTN